MILLGLIILLAAVGAGAWLYIALTDQATPLVNDLTALGVTVGLSPIALLAIGFGLALALALGFAFIRAGISRKGRQRRERKDLERDAQENRRIAEEAAAKRLETERSTSPAPRSFTTPVDDSTTGWRNSGSSETPPPPPPRS